MTAVTLEPKRDSDNTDPPNVDIEIRGDTEVTIVLQDPDRRITVSANCFKQMANVFSFIYESSRDDS